VSAQLAKMKCVTTGAAWAALLLVPWLMLGSLLAWSGPAAAQDTLVGAAERGELLVVRRLLAEGVGVNTRDGRGRTALLAATQRNQVEVARLLINEGADVNARDFIQDTPFLVAGAEGRAEILKLMLGAEPDLKSLNRFGGTALIPACHRGHVETVKVLLSTAIDKDHVNYVGLTALMEAVVLGHGEANHTEIVRLLVAAGANVNIPDRDGITALAHARQRGYVGIVRILEAAGLK
jgi:ankyrin repeat protein